MVKKEKNRLFDSQSIDHKAVIDRLVVESSPRRTFLTMILISSVIATLGLLNDSSAVVIGAMLVAPLLWPVLGVSMGVVVGDFKMIRLSLLSIVFSVLVAIVTAIAITFFYIPLGASAEIIRQTNFGFMIPVAIGAGAAAAFALTYDNIKEAVTGVAISVALLPPLVTIGIGLGGSDWSLMKRATELFGINLAGVVVTALIIFLLLGFRKFSSEMRVAIKKEEKVLKG
ncbi:MAG: TIGR00341 family protein [bacterium]